ncbi:hypothetical protein [Kocuria sp. CPCC 205263]|uniref:hypothetical protein n=1 Tax=Kocuria sp. CPCC 205263 TaxID=3073555 RepID=UPI0034D67654
MTQQPDDLGEANAEVQQEHLSILDEDSLTASTDRNYDRVDDEALGPVTAQPAATNAYNHADPPRPADIGQDG